jgi:hypothetical protein
MYASPKHANNDVNKEQNGKANKIPTQRGNRVFNSVLDDNGFGERLLKISRQDLPLIAEVHASGKWQLCIITGFKVPSTIIKASKTGESCDKFVICPPLANILMIEKGANYQDNTDVEKLSCVVDIGQITSIWKVVLKSNQKSVNDMAMKLSKYLGDTDSNMQTLPVNRIENSMQLLYENCKGNNKSKGLTKKDIVKITSSIPLSEHAQHLDQLLRKGLKAGLNGNNVKLNDSYDAAKIITYEKAMGKFDPIEKLLIGAKLLARDAELGGRFKRSGCIFITSRYCTEDEPFVEEVSLLNGGWTAVDISVKTGTEARKFVERTIDDDDSIASLTSADERILQRLESFAMGEVLQTEDGLEQIDLDVREVLSSMNLSLTPEGAQLALIKSGRWSSNASTKKSSRMGDFEAWSNEILDSARMFAELEEERKDSFCNILAMDSSKSIEGRTNLVALPAVCVDAKRASFRDDAIGVRPRSSTGRKVIEKASKWEILVHIADVSDLYAPKILRPPGYNFDFSGLRKASESRGTSRYDLPFGPLHLMPPIALTALALSTKDMHGKSSRQPVNRCVTLWAYIDERNGKIIDAGLERTLISSPIALTFESASAILDGSKETKSQHIRQAKAIMAIAERNLSLWKQNRLKTDKAASQRESRLKVKEMIAKEIYDSNRNMRDDGVGGSFQRSRGHKLVDQSLDLYGSTLSTLMSKTNAPIPRASGSSKARDGRVATAPLRRYIDGMAQRQALSVLCNYGGAPMTQKACTEANQIVNDATKKIGSGNATKSKRSNGIKKLENHLAAIGGSKQYVVPALSTGKQNEVVISGLGLVVKCGGVKGSLNGGKRLMVKVVELDSRKGLLRVELVE